MIRRYTEFKVSNIPWIKEIPKHWDVIKLKYLLKRIQTGSTPSTKNEDYYDGTINWFTPGDINNQKSLKKSSRTVSPLAVRDNEIKILPKDTVLLVCIGATLGKVAILDEPASFNQQITGLVTNELLNQDYLYYWLLLNRNTINSIANYTTLPIINNEFVKEFHSIVPPKEEQNQIAHFLNKKTLEIDDLISVKEELIELLEEKKQVIITEAITKGINSDVKLKDSKINWIGDIPEHWRISKIKFSSYVKGRIGWQGLRSDEFIDEGPYLVTGTDFNNGTVNWDTCYHISEKRYEEAPEIQLRENDLLVTKDGTIGKVAIVKNKPKKAILNSGIFVIRCRNNSYLTEFMYWVLVSDVFKEYISYTETGSTIKHLYQATFVNFAYPLPEVQEQKEIISYINQRVSEINSVINEVKLIINRLKEYRQSIIYEAVTGKIDVRNYSFEGKEETHVN